MAADCETDAHVARRCRAIAQTVNAQRSSARAAAVTVAGVGQRVPSPTMGRRSRRGSSAVHRQPYADGHDGHYGGRRPDGGGHEKPPRPAAVGSRPESRCGRTVYRRHAVRVAAIVVDRADVPENLKIANANHFNGSAFELLQPRFKIKYILNRGYNYRVRKLCLVACYCSPLCSRLVADQARNPSYTARNVACY